MFIPLSEYKANQTTLESYKSLAGALLQRFTRFKITYIRRAKNSKVDALAQLATAPPESTPHDLHLETLDKPNMSNPTLRFLSQKKTQNLLGLTPISYTFLQGFCPRGNATPNNSTTRLPYMHYGMENSIARDTKEEGHRVLRSLRGGVCENHTGARNLMYKTLRAGYYWPTLEQDAKAIVASCVQCHKFANCNHHPPVPLSIIICHVLFN